MPMISPVGRKAPGTRLLIAGLYVLLGLGGFTMIYPFVLLMAGSTKTGVDIKDVAWVPAFLFDDTALYRKHIEALFNEQLEVMRAVYDRDDASFEKIEPPATIRDAWVHEWNSFSATLDLSTWTIGYMQAAVSRSVPRHLRDFREAMRTIHGPSIDEANLILGTEYASWTAFYLLPEDAHMRRSRPLDNRLGEEWTRFKQEVPPHYRYYFSPEGFFKALFIKTQYTRDIAEYNRAHGTSHASYDDLMLSPVWPAAAAALEQRDWETFVRDSLNLAWISVEGAAAPLYRDYLRARYQSLERLNHQYRSSWRSWEDVPLVDRVPSSGLIRTDWESFITGWTDPGTGVLYRPAADQLRITGTEDAFRAYLQARWNSVEDMNAELGTSFAAWREVDPPQRESHYRAFLSQRSEIRREFLFRNLLTALDYLAFHGRGVANTIIYCALAVLAALLINPLAAYAMSRYRPPSTYKLLLFLLLTMAFPPMVTQIPVFLMMRDLNLLNTFAALILPGLAHGYSIFLLKGFFDALPRDLFESAEIDGAGEWTMFWQITMTLSRPILAVVALQAFTTAYSNFMFALLICQDEAMWTMMVWLYQLQMRSGPGVVYASLLIAAIPTLIIFIFCQNIIMRGIVVPVEK